MIKVLSVQFPIKSHPKSANYSYSVCLPQTPTNKSFNPCLLVGAQALVLLSVTVPVEFLTRIGSVED